MIPAARAIAKRFRIGSLRISASCHITYRHSGRVNWIGLGGWDDGSRVGRSHSGHSNFGLGCPSWAGLLHVNMIKTGERAYCIIAEWTGMDAMAAARPNMIATLDLFRDTLEDLGGGLGVTDPVAGPVVLGLK